MIHLNKRKRNLTLCKKANAIINGVLFLIVLLVFSLVALFGGHIFDEIGPDILNDVEHNASKDAFNEVSTRYDTVLDGLIMIIFIGLWLGGIVAALYSEQHPVIFGVLMFLMIAVLVVAGIFANFYEELFEDATFGTLTDNFPKITWIMTHLLEVSVVIVLSIILALLGKNKV